MNSNDEKAKDEKAKTPVCKEYNSLKYKTMIMTGENMEKQIMNETNEETLHSFLIQERNQNKTLTSPELYQTDITLIAMDEFEKDKVKFKFTKAFPVNLGGIDFNYRTPGEIETTFEFAFSQLLVELV